MRYAIHYQGFIDPSFFNRCRGNSVEGIIKNGKVVVNAHTLVFDDACPFDEGDTVIITAGGNFYAEHPDDIAKRKIERQQRSKKEAEERKQQLNNRRDLAIKFNQTISLPFKWRAGFKPVLSGLSENSMGNGRNRASVNHIQVMEDIQIGRLKRDAQDFLCTKESGKQWLTDAESISFDGNGVAYTPKITCKACLERAKKIAAKSGKT